MNPKAKNVFPTDVKIDLGPAIDLHAFVSYVYSIHYDLLKQHYIRNKMTYVSPLAMGAFACNSHVTNVTLKTKIIWCKY